MDAASLLKVIWPLVVLQLSIQLYSLYDLFKKKSTKNLSVIIWVLIIVLGQILGSVVYLIFGRSEDSDGA